MIRKSNIAFALCGLSLCLVNPLNAATIDIPQVNIDGFATVAGVTTNNNDASYLAAGEDVSFEADTRAGLQFSMNPSSRTQVVLQLMTRAKDNYQLEAEWAYVAFKLNSYAQIRAGRLRIPFYLISDSLEVGYSYPWVRPPIDSYGQFAFSKFTGVDSLIRIPIGESELMFHPHFGTSASDLELMGMSGSFNVKNLVGVNVTWNYDWLTLRLGHTEGDYEVNDFVALDPLANIMYATSGTRKVSDLFAIKERHGQFSGVGVDVDYENIKVMGEYTERKTNGLMTDTSSWYLMFGYRFGMFMPHITYSDFETDTNYDLTKNYMPLLDGGSPQATAVLQGAVGQIAQFNTVNQKSIIVGLRADVLPQVALKFEWQKTTPDKGSNLLSPPFMGGDTFYMGSASGLDDVEVFTLALDLVF
jgi:hypothetical protein